MVSPSITRRRSGAPRDVGSAPYDGGTPPDRPTPRGPDPHDEGVLRRGVTSRGGGRTPLDRRSPRRDSRDRSSSLDDAAHSWAEGLGEEGPVVGRVDRRRRGSGGRVKQDPENRQAVLPQQVGEGHRGMVCV